MITRVYTNHVHNIKNITTIKTKTQNNIQDKWHGNFTYGLEKEISEYIKKELRL